MSTYASSLAIVVGTVSGYHLLKIDSYTHTSDYYPRGTCVRSDDFHVGIFECYIEYYPNGSSSLYSRCVFVILVLDFEGDGRILQHEKARVRFSLLDQGGKSTAYTSSTTVSLHLDQKLTAGVCFPKGSNWEEWLTLKDGCFTIRCNITLMELPRDTRTVDLAADAPLSDLPMHPGVDVMFQVSGESFAVHRCVLAARSPVFKAELFGATKEGTVKGVAQVGGVEAQVFKAFLLFIYMDMLPDFSKEEENWMAQHLLVVADRNDMERLKLICEDKLCKIIDVNSIATTLALAEQHHYRRLKEACLDFLELPMNLKAVKVSDGFEHLSTSCPSVLREIIARLATL